MSNYNSKEKFNLIEVNSHYLRVDDNHPLELLIGINDEGQKTIRFIGSFSKTKVKGTRSIEVNHFQLNNNFIISFSLIDNQYEDIFYLFCNDMIDSSRDITQEMGYIYLVNRFERWRNFSGMTRRYLSESEIKGLIGELLFLKEKLIPKYGISTAIQSWTGTEPLKKDFSVNDTWYEIKAITNDKISISSIDQLDSDELGFLVIYHLEKLSIEASGITINKICEEIFKLINFDQDRQTFIMKLVQANFLLEDYYNQFVFANPKVNFYLVDQDFPKISRSVLASAISNVKFDLIVNMLEDYVKDDIL